MNFGVATGSTCFGSLQSVGSGTQNIYGDVFFVSFPHQTSLRYNQPNLPPKNAYYGVFDASGPQFGFAPATPAGSSPPPTSSSTAAPSTTSTTQSATTA